jgi:Bacterial pre-peptidase C-terminal domain
VVRRVAFLRAASLAVVCAASCSPNRSTDPAPRLFAVHNVMHAMGLYQAGPVSQGTLAEGQERKVAIELPATCVAVVAVGGSGVDDLGLQLLDPEGNVIAEEMARDVQAVLRRCVDRPGKYAVRLRMARGAGEYLVSSWTGGEPPTDKGGSELASGGTCGAPTVMTPGHVYTGSTEEGTDDAEGSCAGSAGGRERVYRLDLPARQRVVIELSAEFDTVLYIRQGDCTDDAAEVKCNDDAGPKRSRIDAVLDAGTYFVFVDGYGDEAGSYRLQVLSRDAPTLADVCRGARPLAASSRVVGALSDGFDNVNATCGREAKGIDAPFRFDLGSRSRVRFVQKSADFRPVVHVRRDCDDAASELGCGDSGFHDDESAWAGVLDAGAYWVFADSAEEGIPGGFTLSAETAAESSTRLLGAPAGDGCGDAVQLTGTSGRVEGDTFAAKDDVPISCAPSGGADVVYRLDLARRSRVTARLVGDESSHALALQRACGERATEMGCGLLVDRVVSPGPYFLVVDGARAESLGRFALAYRVRDMVDVEAACARVPVLAAQRKETGTTSGAADKFSTGCGARSLSQGAPDRIYRFSVSRRTTVRFSLETEGFYGVLSLRRACGDDTSEIKCAEGTDAVSTVVVTTVLEPGTYYAVIDGTTPKAQGAFTLRWEASEESPKPRNPTR